MHQGNIGSAEDCERVIQEVLDRHGRLDILVNNAGITLDKTVRKMTVEDWDHVIQVNLSGAFYLSRAILQHMLDRGSGRIINISSIIGEAGNIGQANYASSKAGLFGLTMSLAQETARKGITVNSVAPGYISTEMVQAVPEGGPGQGHRQDSGRPPRRTRRDRPRRGVPRRPGLGLHHRPDLLRQRRPVHVVPRRAGRRRLPARRLPGHLLGRGGGGAGYREDDMTDDVSAAGRTVISKAAVILMTYLNGDVHTLTEIATATGLPLSTAHRLVRELAAWKILERTDDGDYCVGLPLRLIGGAGGTATSLEERACLVLQDLSQALDADVRLGVLGDRDICFIEKPGAAGRSPRSARARPRPPTRPRWARRCWRSPRPRWSTPT